MLFLVCRAPSELVLVLYRACGFVCNQTSKIPPPQSCTSINQTLLLRNEINSFFAFKRDFCFSGCNQ
jgi:hypothetical protein